MIRFRFEGSSSRNAPQSQPSAEDTPTGKEEQELRNLRSTSPISHKTCRPHATPPFFHCAWSGGVSPLPF